MSTTDDEPFVDAKPAAISKTANSATKKEQIQRMECYDGGCTQI